MESALQIDASFWVLARSRHGVVETQFLGHFGHYSGMFKVDEITIVDEITPRFIVAWSSYCLVAPQTKDPVEFSTESGYRWLHRWIPVTFLAGEVPCFSSSENKLCVSKIYYFQTPRERKEFWYMCVCVFYISHYITNI